MRAHVGYVGGSHEISRRRAFVLSSAFAVGLATTFMLLGIAAALIGAWLGSGSRWWYYLVAAVCFVIGLNMLGIIPMSLPMMFGLTGHPQVSEQKRITPLEKYGVRLMSIGFFLDESSPVIWRGPLVMGLVRQFLSVLTSFHTHLIGLNAKHLCQTHTQDLALNNRRTKTCQFWQSDAIRHVTQRRALEKSGASLGVQEEIAADG